MKLRLKVRDSKMEQVYVLHPDYVFADFVRAIDQAILESKRVAIVTEDDDEIRLDLRQYSAMAITTEP